MSGYYVVSLFRWEDADGPKCPWEEKGRKWYPWRWLAEWRTYPRYFKCRIAQGEWGVIKTVVIPAIAAGARRAET